MNHDDTAEWRQLGYLIYALGAAAIMVFWWLGTGHTTELTTYSANLALGNVTGLLGTYAILWQLVLMGRLTILEKVFGMERLAFLHKWNGYSALTLILAHGLFLTIGFAAADHFSWWKQFMDFLTGYNDVLRATVGTALLVIIVGMSIGIVRRGFKYETWYYVHIFTYLAILLAFGHQLNDGTDFVGQPLFTAYWDALYIVAVLLLVGYRFIRPAWLLAYHQFKVDHLVQETPNVVSVYVTGRHLDRFKYEPGQFLIWRFFTKGRWWQAHPFSLSVAPNGRYLRLTAKELGDFTRAIPALKPGTWISVDGPHGNFTSRRLTKPSLVMIAGGSGITPIRSILERLPDFVTDLTVIYAVRTLNDLALSKEIEPLVRGRGGKLNYLLSQESVPGIPHGFLDRERLRELVPDIKGRDVMLCGPPAMTNSVGKILREAGVEKRLLHTEKFAY